MSAVGNQPHQASLGVTYCNVSFCDACADPVFRSITQDSAIHYSELRMCLSGKSKKNNTVQQYRDTMKKAEEILQHSCNVPPSETGLVAQYISTMLRSRSIYHSDIIFLRCKDVNLEAGGANG